MAELKPDYPRPDAAQAQRSNARYSNANAVQQECHDFGNEVFAAMAAGHQPNMQRELLMPLVPPEGADPTQVHVHVTMTAHVVTDTHAKCLNADGTKATCQERVEVVIAEAQKPSKRVTSVSRKTTSSRA